MQEQLRFNELSDSELLAEVKRLAGRERSATSQLIRSLIELDTRRLFLSEGCASLFAYCTRVLHLSEHAAYGRIEAARAASKFPVILELLEEGAITLTTVTLLGPLLTPENFEKVLQAARGKSRREIELLTVTLRPGLPSNAERWALPEIKPITAEHYRLQVTLTRETYEKLCRAQALLRHALPNGDPADILDRALTRLLRELEKTKWAGTKRPTYPGRVRSTSRAIPAAVKREVWQRDGGRCAFIGSEGRCGEAAFVEYHHLIPFTEGGLATVENLQLRCRAHNQYEAERWFSGDREIAG